MRLVYDDSYPSVWRPRTTKNDGFTSRPYRSNKNLAFKYIFSLKLYEKEFFLTFVTLKVGFHYVSFPVLPKVDHNQLEHFENP